MIHTQKELEAWLYPFMNQIGLYQDVMSKIKKHTGCSTVTWPDVDRYLSEVVEGKIRSFKRPQV